MDLKWHIGDSSMLVLGGWQRASVREVAYSEVIIQHTSPVLQHFTCPGHNGAVSQCRQYSIHYRAAEQILHTPLWWEQTARCSGNPISRARLVIPPVFCVMMYFSDVVMCISLIIKCVFIWFLKTVSLTLHLSWVLAALVIPWPATIPESGLPPVS